METAGFFMFWCFPEQRRYAGQYCNSTFSKSAGAALLPKENSKVLALEYGGSLNFQQLTCKVSRRITFFKQNFCFEKFSKRNS